MVIDHGGGTSLWCLIMLVVDFFLQEPDSIFFLYRFRDTAIRNIVFFIFFNW